MNNTINITQNTEEWLAWRNGKIGASDIPIILGLSPYCTPLTLWKRMCGFSGKQEENFAMRRGKSFEPMIRESLNKQMEADFQPLCVTHPELKWAIASLDGIDINRKQIMEIKCNSKDKHQMALNGKVPVEHYPQLQWQLFVTEYDVCLYVSYWEQEEMIIEVKRDDHYIASTLLPAASAFLKMVIDLEPPPSSENTFLEIDDIEFETLATKWIDINRQLKDLEKQEKILRSSLVSFSDDGNCQGGGIKISRINREGTIDWKKLYETILKDYVEINKNEKYDAERYRKEQIGYWKIEEMAS